MPLFAMTGITGHVRGVVEERPLAQDARVLAAVHSGAGTTTVGEENGGESDVVSLDNAQALTRAFERADGVYVMATIWFENLRSMFAVNVRAVESLGQAFLAIRPGRIVLLLSISAHYATGTGAILNFSIWRRRSTTWMAWPRCGAAASERITPAWSPPVCCRAC